MHAATATVAAEIRAKAKKKPKQAYSHGLLMHSYPLSAKNKNCLTKEHTSYVRQPIIVQFFGTNAKGRIGDPEPFLIFSGTATK